MTAYHTHQLPNGLRIIHLPSDSKVVFCGYAVKAGTRHERQGEEGLAHFCEHLSFKGTQRRSAVQIINALEGVGGELNAFTNKEDTVYYAAITNDHLSAAVDVLSDMVFFSQFPEHEMEKECEVVCDEIESYEDSPAELIYDEFENILFSGHPLGHNILGTAERVRSYRPAHARAFTQRYYQPANCIFFASGQLDFNRLVRMLEKATLAVPAADLSAQAEGTVTKDAAICPDLSAQTQQPIIRQRGTHQAHVMIGTRTFPVSDNRRWALCLLNNILGGPGMNSRLNLSLRERNALVYTVESTMVSYSDTGLWTVYFGCDPHDVNRCLRLVRRELNRCMQQPLSKSALAKAKQQMKGQLTIASDHREQYALDFAKNFLHQGKERNLNDILAHLEALSETDIQQVAQQLFAPERLVTLIYE